MGLTDFRVGLNKANDIHDELVAIREELTVVRRILERMLELEEAK